MLGSFFSSIGSGIGKYFGSGILSSIGRYAGRYIGDFLERKWFYKKEVFQKYSNLKESFSLSMAKPGSPIALIFGKTRVSGKIIWADEIKTSQKLAQLHNIFGNQNFSRFQSRLNLQLIILNINISYLLLCVFAKVRSRKLLGYGMVMRL